MHISQTLTPGDGDHPCWHVGGTELDIPLLFLEGGPVDTDGFMAKASAWSIRPLCYGSYGEAIRYFRELAAAASGLADRLEQMDAERDDTETETQP